MNDTLRLNTEQNDIGKIKQVYAVKLDTNYMHPYTLTRLQDLANFPTRGVVLPKHSHLEVCMTW